MDECGQYQGLRWHDMTGESRMDMSPQQIKGTYAYRLQSLANPKLAVRLPHSTHSRIFFFFFFSLSFFFSFPFSFSFKVEDEGPQLTFSSSPAEEDAIKEAFGLIDPKNTGEIRIPAFLRSIKMNLKVQALFRKHPLLTPILNTREVVSRFKEFDKDGDGLVSVQEVLQFATSSFIKSHVQLQD